MAAELEHLIDLYRRRGIERAAAVLAVAKDGLLAHGLLPAHLEGDESPGPEGESERQIDIRHGKVRIRGRHLSLAQEHELDALHLGRHARNALVRSGFSTIADLEWGASRKLLHLVDHLGERSVREIAVKIERPWPYLLRADGTPTRARMPSLADGRGFPPDGERPGGHAQPDTQPTPRKRRQP